MPPRRRPPHRVGRPDDHTGQQVAGDGRQAQLRGDEAQRERQSEAQGDGQDQAGAVIRHIASSRKRSLLRSNLSEVSASVGPHEFLTAVACGTPSPHAIPSLGRRPVPVRSHFDSWVTSPGSRFVFGDDRVTVRARGAPRVRPGFAALRTCDRWIGIASLSSERCGSSKPCSISATSSRSSPRRQPRLPVASCCTLSKLSRPSWLARLGNRLSRFSPDH